MVLASFALLAALQGPSPERNLQKWKQGVDFYATGNEPSWSLDLDLDQAMRFDALGGPSLTTPSVDGVRAQDGDVVRYRATTDGGVLAVQIVAGECRDTMADEVFSHRVSVEVRTSSDAAERRYEGCGRYVVDPRLDGVWVLSSIDGEDFDAEGLPKGRPTLELHTREMRAIGHGGCNQFTGTFGVEGHRIFFGPAAATRMACPGMEQEDRFFSSVLRRTHDFDIEDGRLLLRGGDGPVVVFRKAG